MSSRINNTSDNFAPSTLEAPPRNEGYGQRIRPVGPDAVGMNQTASASGIMDSTSVDPLTYNKSEAQEWAETSRPAGAATNWTASATSAAQNAATIATGAATTATGAAKFGYGHVTGNEELKSQGSEQIWGKQ
ncbi:hypothetical protein EXIGLDRAFT_839805 [Exidia glandulosa HHB12029]|uniref:Uncharacterized protein n=1 Tax=Exidia glandulosa HHB12029 TaxID=1314781 RepID=A0A165ETA8_EXIGL|nr:hypothetical protein EXIGLDRAFT_839805 [Exidia glandulosa HHB12029]